MEYRAIVDDNHESEGGDEEEKGKGEGEGEGEGKEKMVALIRLLKYGEGEYEMDWTTRWPLPLVEGMSEQVMGEGFFEPMARQHVSAMGERGHFRELLFFFIPFPSLYSYSSWSSSSSL